MDPRARLQAHLGSAFVLGRVLDGGGLALLGNRELQGGRLSRGVAAYKSQYGILASRGAIAQFDGLIEALGDAFIRGDAVVAVRSGEPIAPRRCWLDSRRESQRQAARKPDSAIAHDSAYLAVLVLERQGTDYFALAQVQKRLGELYDFRNDRAKAIEHHAAFVEQWKDVDPEFPAGVASVRKRLKELQDEEGN